MRICLLLIALQSLLVSSDQMRGVKREVIKGRANDEESNFYDERTLTYRTEAPSDTLAPSFDENYYDEGTLEPTEYAGQSSESGYDSDKTNSPSGTLAPSFDEDYYDEGTLEPTDYAVSSSESVYRTAGTKSPSGGDDSSAEELFEAIVSEYKDSAAGGEDSGDGELDQLPTSPPTADVTCDDYDEDCMDDMASDSTQAPSSSGSMDEDYSDGEDGSTDEPIDGDYSMAENTSVTPSMAPSEAEEGVLSGYPGYDSVDDGELPDSSSADQYSYGEDPSLSSSAENDISGTLTSPYGANSSSDDAEHQPPADESLGASSDLDDTTNHPNDWSVASLAEKTPKQVMQMAEDETNMMLHDKYVPLVAAAVGIVCFAFTLVVAQQMVENPTGCVAKICRCTVAVFRILCWPIKMILCCGGSRAADRRDREIVPSGDYGEGGSFV